MLQPVAAREEGDEARPHLRGDRHSDGVPTGANWTIPPSCLVITNQRRDPDAMRPMLMINPTTDDSFERSAKQAVDETDGDIEAAQRRLRYRYPRAVIRARDISGEPIAVWYVYREGLWVSR